MPPPRRPAPSDEHARDDIARDPGGFKPESRGANREPARTDRAGPDGAASHRPPAVCRPQSLMDKMADA